MSDIIFSNVGDTSVKVMILTEWGILKSDTLAPGKCCLSSVQDADFMVSIEGPTIMKEPSRLKIAVVFTVLFVLAQGFVALIGKL